MSPSSTFSSPPRLPRLPSRDAGRQRVAGLIEAAAQVIQEKGYAAATMAEIAARADARVGSLYRFFPSKEAITEALIERYATVLAAEYDSLRGLAAGATPQALADRLIDQFVRLSPQTQAVRALLDARADSNATRQGLRIQALGGIGAALKAGAPHLTDGRTADIAIVVLNNMKAMIDMTDGSFPSSPGAIEELKLMNRLYLSVALAS